MGCDKIPIERTMCVKNTTKKSSVVQESVTDFQSNLVSALESAQIKKLQSRLRLEQEYFNIMQEFSNDILFRLNLKEKTLVFHQSRVKIFGFPTVLENFPDENRAGQMVHQEDLDNYMAYCQNLILGIEGKLKVRIRLANGTFETFIAHSKAFCDEKGNPLEMLGKLENIQKYIDLETKSKTDALTNDLNKISFEEKVKEHLNLNPIEKSAFYFIDLDDFKGINDKKGHSFGDYILKTVGKILRNNIRDSDLLGRVGGDEFTLFLPHVPNNDVALEKGKLILQALNKEFSYENQSVTIHASIGIAVYPTHGSDFQTLYQNADISLYEAKGSGKNNVSIYNEVVSHSKKAVSS